MRGIVGLVRPTSAVLGLRITQCYWAASEFTLMRNLADIWPSGFQAMSAKSSRQEPFWVQMKRYDPNFIEVVSDSRGCLPSADVL